MSGGYIWSMGAVGPFHRDTGLCNDMHVCKETFWSYGKAPMILSQDRWCISWGAICSSPAKDEMPEREAVVAAVQPFQTHQSSPGMGSPITCYECNGPNYFMRNCVKRWKTTHVHYYQCNKTHHLVRNCLRNKSRDKMSVPAYSTLLSMLTVHHAQLSLTLGTHGPSWAQSYVSLSQNKTW